MSEGNVGVVREMLAAWVAGDFESALEAFEPDVVWDNSPLPEGLVAHGIDEMQQGLRRWVGTWNDYWAEFDEMIDAGDHVVVIGREGGRAKASGVIVSQPSIVVYTLNDRKIIAAKNYKSRAEALEAAGLRE
jgi:ketosteroid isomerase-like protein